MKQNNLINGLKQIAATIVGEDCLEALKNTITTGVDILDIYAGNGFVLGTINTIAGMPHAGKSTLSIQLSANIQKKYDDAVVIYFDSENAVTIKRLASLGIDTDRLVFINGDITIEKIFKTIDEFITYKEKNPQYKDTQFIVIWDSLAATTTDANLETNEIQNTDGARRAKIIAEFLPRYVGKLKKYNILFLIVNQLREKIKMSMYESSGITIKGFGNYSMPGGAAVYYASFHLLTMKVKDIINEETYGFSGSIIECVFVKNKLSRPLTPFKLVLDVDRGFSNFWTNFIYLQEYGYITKAAWKSLEGYEGKFRTKDAIKLYQTNPQFKQAFDVACEKVHNDIRKKITLEIHQMAQEVNQIPKESSD